jgi:hypothetical protein
MQILTNRTGAGANNPAYIIFMTDGDPNIGGDHHGKFVDTDGVVVFAVGIDVSDSGDALRAISSEKGYDGHASNPLYKGAYFIIDNAYELYERYSDFSGAMRAAATEAVVRDEIGADFELYEDASRKMSASSGTASYNSQTREITWVLGEAPNAPATLTYYVKLKNANALGTSTQTRTQASTTKT